MYGGRLAGTNVNGTEGGRVQLNKEWKLPAGTEIYRNYDRRFSARLEGARARRSVRVSVTVSFDEGAVSAEFRDGDGCSATATGRRGNRRRCWRCSVRSLSGRAIPCSMWRRCVLRTVWRECLSCGFPRRTLCDGRGWKRCCVTGRSAGPRDIRPGRLPDAVIRTVRPRLRRT